MATKDSPWRQRSAEVIAEVLAGLPADTSEKECRRALRAAYPFGSPGEASHPYKMWLKEVRLAMDKRFRAKKEKAIAPPHLVFFRSVSRPLDRWWLEVRCGWHARLGPCLVCGPLHEAVKEALAHPDLVPMLKEAMEDRQALPVAADLVEEVTGHRPVVMGK